MIKTIWSLAFENKIVGVRVQTHSNQYFDIDIDTCKNVLRLDPSSLNRLALLEFNGSLMTEEEFSTGQLVMDASNLKLVLSDIKDFMTSTAKSDPLLYEKRRKKLEEYKKIYFTYLASKWLPEFAEYHLANFEGNSNIYESLTEQQRILVKKYFRWRSKLLFDEQNVSKVLRKNLNKAKKLVSLMGNADDWYYDGTVDTGYLGCSTCELGHPLRYEHYAYSPLLNKSIIFGATCMEDFFELDKSVLNSIMKAQEKLLKEIKAIVFVMQTGKFPEYREQYAELHEMLSHFNFVIDKQFKDGDGWSAFMNEFDRLSLPLTRPMILKYKDFVKAFKHETSESALYSRVKEAMSDMLVLGYDEDLIHGVMYDKFNSIVARNLKTFILFKQYKHPFVAAGLDLLSDLLKAQDILNTCVGKSMYFNNQFKQDFYFITVNGKRRLATKKEILYKAKGLKKEPYFGVIRTKDLYTLLKLIKAYVPAPWQELPSEMSSFATTFADNFTEHIDSISRVIPWILSSQFSTEIEVLNNPINLLDSAQDECINTESIRYRYDFVAEHVSDLQQKERFQLRSVSVSTLDYSSESRDVVDQLYNNLLRKLGVEDTEQSDSSVSLDTNLELKLNRIVNASITGELKKDDFVLKIVATIRKTGRMTPKQKKFVDDAISKLSR